MKPTRNLFVRLLSLSAITLLGSHSAQAITYTWNGVGSGVNWSAASNFNALPTSDTATDLIFAGVTNVGTVGTPLNQNIVDPFVLNSITFSSGGGAFFLGGNALQFDGSGNAGTITQNSSSAVSIANVITAAGKSNNTTTITLTGNGAGIVTLSGNILKSNGLRDYAITKTGSSTYVLSGAASDYTGVTTINGGVLSVATIGNGGVAGNLGAATNAAANLVLGGGTLRYTGTTASTNRNFTLTGGTSSTIEVVNAGTDLTISGVSTNTTGGLAKIGAGKLILSGLNLYTGLTTVSAGTLEYGITNALSSGAVTVNGGILDIKTFSDSVGAVTLTSGSINGTSGVLTGTSYVLDGAGNTGVSAILAGAATLTKSNAGTATLSGANTYTGSTSIIAGTFVVNGNQSAANGGVTIANIATLYGIGTVGGPTVIHGTQSPGASSGAVGTQNFSNSLTYSTGSIFEWDLNVTGGIATFDKVVANSLGGSGAQFKIVGTGDGYAAAFWDTNRNWTSSELFGTNNATVNLSTIFTTTTSFNPSPSQGSFSFTNDPGGGTGNRLTWTAVPEPTSALVGVLLGAGLLRRKRR